MQIRTIILGLGLLGASLTAVVGGIGFGGLRWVGSGRDEAVTSTRATQAATMADMMHDGLRGDVFQALMRVHMGDADGIRKARKEAQEHADEFGRRVAEGELSLAIRVRPGDDHSVMAGLAETVTRLRQTVARLDDMTQQNAALVEQSAAAAGSLTSQAAQLNGVVRSFQLDTAA